MTMGSFEMTEEVEVLAGGGGRLVEAEVRF
jgi:hypothetical protein